VTASRTSVQESQLPKRKRRSSRSGFAVAAISFVAVFAAGAVPIPLYDTYRSADGVTNAELSLVAVTYFAGAVFALLVLGRLSNHLGRRPVSIAALVIAAAGCLVFLTVDGAGPLMIGRGLQGLAAGLAASAIGAYAVDTAPASPRWLVSTVTSASTNVGLAIGAFASGALVQYGPAPRRLIYHIAAAALSVCAVLVVFGPETVSRTAGIRRSLVPRLRPPPAVRPFLPVAASIFVATWALGGYYQAFSPSVTADDLGSASALVTAAVFASYMAPSVFGRPLTARMTAATAQRLGMGVVTLATAGLLTAIAMSSPVLFIAVGVIGGLGMGVGMAASMRTLLPLAAPAERAGLLALVYAISYTGASVPSLIAGQLSRSVTLLDSTIGYGALALIAFVVTLLAARNPTVAA